MGQRRVTIALAVICLLQAAAAALAQSSEVRLDIPVRNNPSLGESRAKVTIVEFSDYQCPLSGRHYNSTFRDILEDYVKTGKVKYVFGDLPLQSIHPLASKAAEAARCAGEQGKYWQMHDRLFNNQGSLQPEILPLHADVLHLDGPKFRDCLNSGRYAVAVEESAAAARTAGSQGTPDFFLGPTGTDESKLRAVRHIPGAQPYAIFKAVIEALLSETRE